MQNIDWNEELMTDLQFLEYKRVYDELAEARQEIAMLRSNQGASGSDGMTDYQFRRYEEYRDKCEVLEKEVATLCREKNIDALGMTDYQFKYMMELKDENAALKEEIARLRMALNTDGGDEAR